MRRKSKNTAVANASGGGLEGCRLISNRLSLGGKPAPVLGGPTGGQRFFMAFAQSWREIQRPDQKMALAPADRVRIW